MAVELRQRTPVEPLHLRGLIDHRSRLVMLGSCFAESMGTRLVADLFDVTVNPFGTLYNPASISRAIDRLLLPRPYVLDDLLLSDGLWRCSDCHSRLASSEASKALDMVNSALERGVRAAAGATIVVITLGTSWAYIDRTTGQVVANCHKRPANQFERRMLKSDESAALLIDALRHWIDVCPGLHVILTVSPIRHTADGLAGNSLSKAMLMVAAHRVADALGPQTATYFPSYEIMLDDLRDYRWYASDMKHPSDQAIDYIYRVFGESVMTAGTLRLADSCRRLSLRAAHRDLSDLPGAADRRQADLKALAAPLMASEPYLAPRINSLIHNH